MTRLEAGGIEAKLEPVDIEEIVGAALERAAAILDGHRVKVSLAPDVPMLRADPLLLEQALFNLLDNAAKYAPAGSAIELRAVRDGDAREAVARVGAAHDLFELRAHALHHG